jgi:hypothetical protein
MFSFDVRKQAGWIAAAAMLILTFGFAPQAQGQTAKLGNGLPSGGICQDGCAANCTDEFPPTPGCRGAACGAARANCIIQCERACQPKPPVQISPRYLVLALMYAPPGCTNTAADKCAIQGNVSYGASSSTGTQISASASFQVGEKVSVGSEVASETQNFQVTTTNSTSETVTKTQGLTLSTGGIQDGVNHDLDEFILLTDPVVTIQETSSAVLWNLGVSGGSFNIFPVTVGELRNPSTMPADVARHFAALGFTNSDFQTILTLDPFASAGTGPTVDPAQFPNRYTYTGYNLGYNPPGANSCTNGVCPCVNTQQPIINEADGTIGSSVQAQYSVDVSLGSLKQLGLVSDTSFTWTATAAQQNTVKNSQTAALLLACPSPAYNGPATIDVYWDSLYGTFEFYPVPDTIVVQQGTVTTAAGKALPGVPVALAYGGKTLRTFTDYRGRYKFAVAPAKSRTLPNEGLVSVKGERRTVPLRSAALTEFRIP